MKKIRNILVSLGLVFAFTAPVAAAGTSFALFEDAKQQACAGANLSDTGCVAGQGEAKVGNTLSNIINILSIVVGVIAVIMLIIGGIRYMTSNGDGNSAAGARKTIIYALVGLTVAALSQAIVKFILQGITK